MKKMNKKGFTLIEMLVVIAIIAVLVSIVIPVVGNSTEKAKEAKDAANIRSAIAEVTTMALAGTLEEAKVVNLTQTGAWETEDITDIGGFKLKDADGNATSYFTGTSVSIYYCEKHHAVTVGGKDATGLTHTHNASCTAGE